MANAISDRVHPAVFTGYDEVAELKVLLQVNADRSRAGGVQSVARGLQQHLRRSGHSVRCSWSAGSEGAVEDDTESIDSLHVRPDGTSWRRPFHFPSLIRTARLLARFRPDVVNLHYASSTACYFVLLRNLFNYRIVMSCHGSDILKPLPHDDAHLDAMLKAADAITVVSPELTDKIAERGLDHAEVHYLPNGVDTEFWKPSESELGSAKGNEDLHIVTAGRLEKVKGYDLLIESFAKVRERNPHARLSIFGEGSQEPDLRQRIAALDLEEAVDLPGVKPREELRESFRDADMFVLSSRSEGMPLVLMEAMASGLPCVATDVGSVALLGGSVVDLVEPEDAGALSEAMISLGSNPCLREKLGVQGRRQAQQFSSSDTMRKYEEVLQCVR